MKYVSLDLETTGLDPTQDQVLQIGMVLEDTDNIKPLNELPRFEAIIKHPRYSGNYYAMFELNYGLIARCEQEGVSPQDAWQRAQDWLHCHGISPNNRGTVAGKNVAGFDMPFCPKSFRSFFRHRCLDPGSVFVDWSKDRISALGDLLPASEIVTHDAVEDALAVVRVLRKAYAPGGDDQ